VRNQKQGLLFYGFTGRATQIFQGGWLCVAPPRFRTPNALSGGNPATVDDCSGSFSIDLAAFAAGALGGAPEPALRVAGQHVFSQWWGRDPGFAPPNNTTLSDALEHVLTP
jgi:hypothetical protein